MKFSIWNIIKTIVIFSTFSSLLISEKLHVELVLQGLNKPIYLTGPHARSDTLFIVEQGGRIKTIIQGRTHGIILDIKDHVHQPKMPGDERGLLGMALHPRFMDNGQFYVNYVNREGNTIIAGFTCHEGTLHSDSSNEQIILSVIQPYANHNGGQLAFGHDGFLYVGLGDGGYAGDPKLNGQNLNTLLGTILRIDIDDNKPYSIPKDNPFHDHQDARGEIFCYGLRNPWRFSFDRIKGDIYIADVGQSSWEEINHVLFDDAFGKNFGWNIMEGSHCYPIGEDCETNDLTFPAFEYPNNANYVKTLICWNQNDAQGCSVTGGYVYRGNLVPELKGKYFFGDYCTGKIWSIQIDDEKKTIHEQWEIIGIKDDLYLSSFGEDGNGELFLINHTGEIYKMVGVE